MNILLKTCDMTGAVLSTGDKLWWKKKNHFPERTYILVKEADNKQLNQPNI